MCHRLCAQNLSYENECDLHENDPVVGNHSHMNGSKDLQRSKIFEDLRGSLPISLKNLSLEDLCKLFQLKNP